MPGEKNGISLDELLKADRVIHQLGLGYPTQPVGQTETALIAFEDAEYPYDVKIWEIQPVLPWLMVRIAIPMRIFEPEEYEEGIVEDRHHSNAVFVAEDEIDIFMRRIWGIDEMLLAVNLITGEYRINREDLLHPVQVSRLLIIESCVGRRCPALFTFIPEEQAEAELAAFRAQCESGPVSSGQPMVRAMVDLKAGKMLGIQIMTCMKTIYTSCADSLPPIIAPA